MHTWKIMAAFAAALMVFPALADDVKTFDLSIKDHKFEPAMLEIPAGEKVKLKVKNLDTTPEEFESHDFNREKVIPGGSETSIFVGPLKAGEYKFFGEFHQDTAQGKVIVR